MKPIQNDTKRPGTILVFLFVVMAATHIAVARLQFLLNGLKLLLFPRSKGPQVSPSNLVELAHQERNIRMYMQSYYTTLRLDNCRFIHVGKCGGSSVGVSFLEAGIHVPESHVRQAPLDPSVWYFIWVRDPISRFVSLFNHSKSILAFDLKTVSPNDLSLENCPAPARIFRRYRTGHAWSRDYEFLIDQFDTANDLAEALYDWRRPKTKLFAHLLIRHPSEHLYKGLGWYLQNGQWIEKFSKNILFVGELEAFEEDFDELLQRLGLESRVPLKHLRANSDTFSKTLSKKAKASVERFYDRSDYRSLATLKRLGHLSGDTKS